MERSGLIKHKRKKQKQRQHPIFPKKGGLEIAKNYGDITLAVLTDMAYNSVFPNHIRS